MPELPEVETICNSLMPKILGQKITSINVNQPKLRVPVTIGFDNLVKNSIIKNCKRRAKYIIWQLSNDMVIIIHLGMSGRLIYQEKKNAKNENGKHDHIVFHFDNDSILIYNDPRRFGMVIALKSEFESIYFKSQGIEPLSEEFNGIKLKKIVANKTCCIKSLLMNNKCIVGIGNIYASESLFLSKISPFRSSKDLSDEECNQLSTNIKIILNEAIKAGGSTFKNYSQISGEPGYFQHSFKVYGKAGTSCKFCKNNILVAKINGRSSFYCPECQK